MSKLSGEELFFLLNEEEKNLLITEKEKVLVKAKISDDILAIYVTNVRNLRELDLWCFFSVSRKEVIVDFRNSIYSETDGTNIHELKNKCDLLIDKEIENMHSFIPEDPELMKDNALIERARNYVLEDTRPQYRLPKDIHRLNYSPLEYIKMALEPEEFAYSLVENYVSEHKEFFIAYQEYMALNKLFEDISKSLGTELRIKKVFNSIAANEKLKNVTICYETATGKEEQVKVQNKAKNLHYLPFYAITRILHGRTEVYSRSIKIIELENLKSDEELNLKKFTQARETHYIDDELNLSMFMSCLNLDKLNSNHFLLKLVEYDLNARRLPEKKLSDIAFLNELLEDKSIYKGGLSSFWCYVKEPALSNKDLALKAMKVNYSVLLSLPENFQEDSDIQKIFIDNVEYSYLSWNNYNSCYKGKKVHEIKGMKERILKKSIEDEDFLLPNEALKYFEEEDIAIKNVRRGGNYVSMYGDGYETNFSSLHENLRSNKNFVKLYVEKVKKVIEMSAINKHINFGSIYKHLSDTLKADYNLIVYLLKNTIVTSWYAFGDEDCSDIIPKFLQTFEVFELIALTNRHMMSRIPEDFQREIIKKHLDLFVDSSLAYWGKLESNKDIFYLVAEKKPNLFKRLPISYSLNEDDIISLLEKNLDVWYYVSNIRSEKLLDYISDKMYVLSSIDFPKYNKEHHPTSNKKFIKNQLKFVNGKLTDIPSATRSDSFTLLDDEEIVEYSFNLNSKNLWGLPAKSKFRDDAEFAKKVLVKDINLFAFFNFSVRRNEEVLKYVYKNLKEDKQVEFLALLPKTTQKELKVK